MHGSERFAKIAEGGYYIIASAVSVAALLFAMEKSGYPVMRTIKRLRAEFNRKLSEEQFRFYYENIWPSVRKVREVGEDASQSE